MVKLRSNPLSFDLYTILYECSNTLSFGLDCVTDLIAGAKHTFEQLHAQNSKNQKKEQNDEKHIAKCRYGLQKTIHHSFDALILANHPQWP